LLIRVPRAGFIQRYVPLMGYTKFDRTDIEVEGMIRRLIDAKSKVLS
jgi:hypothetical protein